jgi:hypothetical protein
LLIVIGASVLIELVMLFRRQETSHPGLIQVRLGDWGCVQYDNLNGPSLLFQTACSHLWAVPCAVALGLVIAFSSHLINAMAFWIFLALSILKFPSLWRLGTRLRRSFREVRDNSLADANAPISRPMSWNLVSGFSLARISDTTHRLIVKKETHFFRLETASYPVDAEIKCTAEQAEKLRELIQEWIARK